MKNNQISGEKFEVPCGRVMEGTHMRPKCWVKRLVDAIHCKRPYSGRLFSF
jgi:hypothetical protein